MSTADTQVLHCQCGAKLRAPAAAAGKRIRCPKCQFTMTIPQAGNVAVARMSSPSAAAPRPTAANPVAPAAPPPPPDTGGGLLDELFQAESAAAATVAAPTGAPCPKCGRAMKGGTTLCGTCGYDSNPKPKASAPSKPGKADAAKAAAAKAATAGGKFALGCVLSGAFALAAVVVWYIIATKTGRTFGLFAWGVGVAAGFGMMLGVGKEHELSGMAAGGLALGAVIIAKILIWQSDWSPQVLDKQAWPSQVAEHRAHVACFEKDLYLHGEACSNIEERESELADAMPPGELSKAHDEALRWQEERWSNPDYVKYLCVQDFAQKEILKEAIDSDKFDTGSDDKSWEKHKAEAVKRAEALTPEQRLAKVKEQEEGPIDHKDVQKLVSKVTFWWALLNPWALFCMGLATVTAYRISGGGKGPS